MHNMYCTLPDSPLHEGIIIYNCIMYFKVIPSYTLMVALMVYQS